MTRKEESVVGDVDWVKSAMTDDSAVAELLTLFRQTENKKKGSLEWTIRQPRSKTAVRVSPTTPLSWSGDGSDEREVQLNDGVRSKVTVAGGINKRSRKKKTLAELKEEENLLVNERGDLKKQLETFRSTLENQRAMNESLKRYKIDLQSKSPLEKVLVGPYFISNPSQMQLQSAAFANPLSSISTEDIRNEVCDAFNRLPSKVENYSENFVLPDLNLSFDEHSNIELL